MTISRLLQCSADTLGQLSILCGLPVQSTKAARARALVDGMKMARNLPPTLKVMAVDMGIKNFSYCQTTDNVVEKWTKVDLHQRYGLTFSPLMSDPNSFVDSRRYLSHLAYNIVDELVVDNPNIIMVETQRTRSNNMKSTLPNVLLNYTLENMIYAVLYARQTSSIIIPMNANNMVSYWLNRFVDKTQLGRNPKKLRIKLVFDWLVNDGPMVMSHQLPPDFEELTTPKKTRALLHLLGLPPTEKIDDLVDSLLYALTANHMVANQRKLADVLAQDGDIASLVHILNQNHLHLIDRLCQDGDITLNKYYVDY